MKTGLMKTARLAAALALCWSVARDLAAQRTAANVDTRQWTIQSVGTETATPDVYYILMKMEFESSMAADATAEGEKRLHVFLAAVDALKIPNLSYRICNNLITPAESLSDLPGAVVYTRNIVFTLLSPREGEQLPARDAIIAKLEDLGARYNSHCVTCIGSG